MKHESYTLSAEDTLSVGGWDLADPPSFTIKNETPGWVLRVEASVASLDGSFVYRWERLRPKSSGFRIEEVS